MKNSARRAFRCLIRLSAPVLSRSVRSALPGALRKPWTAGIDCDRNVMEALLRQAGTGVQVSWEKTTARRGSKPARDTKGVSNITGAPSFSPYQLCYFASAFPNFTRISLFATWIDWMALINA